MRAGNGRCRKVLKGRAGAWVLLLSLLMAAAPALATDPCPEPGSIDQPLAFVESYAGDFGTVSAGAGTAEGSPASLEIDVPGNAVAAYLYWGGEVHGGGPGATPGTSPDPCVTLSGGALSDALELCGSEVGRRTMIFNDENSCGGNGGEVVMRAELPLWALQVGANRFEVTGFNDIDPGSLCPPHQSRHFRRNHGLEMIVIHEDSIDCSTPQGEDCEGKIHELTLTYTGLPCSNISNDQSGKASCTGEAGGTSPVTLLVTDKKGKVHGEFHGVVLEQSVTVLPQEGEKDKFSSDTQVQVLDDATAEVLAEVHVHTSCSKPLHVGDAFGPITVAGFRDDVGDKNPADCLREVILLEGADLVSESTNSNGDNCEDDFRMKEACFEFAALDCDSPATLRFAVGGVEINAVAPSERTWFDRGSDASFVDPEFGLIGTGELIEADLLNVDPLAGFFSGERQASFAGDVTLMAGDTLACFQVETLPQVPGSAYYQNLLVSSAILEFDRNCPAAPEPKLCDGGLRQVVMTYLGADCGAISNSQEGKATCTGDALYSEPVRIVLEGKNIAEPSVLENVMIGDSFEINAKKDKIGSSTTVVVVDPLTGTELARSEFHTSCSKPFAVGDQFGPVIVDDFTSKNDPDPGSTGSSGTPGVCEGGVVEITFEYNGETCENNLSNPQAGKASCEGDPQFQSPVRIVASSKNLADPSSFDGISVGDTFTLHTSKDRLGANTTIQLLDPATGVELADLAIHTSCSKPLAVGDQFGPLTVRALTSKGKK